MSVVPSPEAVYDRAKEEGSRRLSMPLLEQVVDGALPDGATRSLVHTAEDIAGKAWEATLVRAVLAGALIDDTVEPEDDADVGTQYSLSPGPDQFGP